MWVTDELPAFDMIVMLRLDSVDFPVWIGHHDGHSWVSINEFPSSEIQVIGWMPLDSAAKILDRRRS